MSQILFVQVVIWTNECRDDDWRISFRDMYMIGVNNLNSGNDPEKAFEGLIYRGKEIKKIFLMNLLKYNKKIEFFNDIFDYAL